MTRTFPKNFLWGSSTSAYQVEGNNFNCDWYEWEKEGNCQPCGYACKHYELFAQDILMASELGHNSHRLGLEWSSLEPIPAKWSREGWDHYKQVLDVLAAKNIEPLLTLHHFTLPLWLSKEGGWLNPDAPYIFKRFSEKAARELSGRVKYWITINEPNILAVLAYLRGQWPPCHKNFNETIAVLKNMLKAHALSYSAIKKYAGSDSRVGIAKAVTAFHPYSLFSLADRISAHKRNIFHNHFFISSLVKGKIKSRFSKSEKLPCSGSLDFIGINYYFRQFIKGDDLFKKFSFGNELSPPARVGPRQMTDMGWEIYPEGLYEVMRSLSKYRLPLIVTENGIATQDDNVRQMFIREHLLSLSKALKKGLPVSGYLHWSLLDNFEWDSGYSKKFGLVEVDFDTMERKIRPSARYYSDIIKDGPVN